MAHTYAHKPNALLRWTRMLWQAKAPTNAADWAQAYAELAKEKDAQLSVLTKTNRMLTKEKEVLAQQLAAAISQCNALGNSTGLLGALVTLGCEALSLASPRIHCGNVRCVQL